MQVATPAFALLQLSCRLSLTRIVMLGIELCGTFAVYRPAPPVKAFLQALLDRRGLPKIGGWEPCLDTNGRLTELWSRPPLATPHDLATVAARSDSRRGAGRLAEAARLVKPGAASPFEAQTGILLGFPRRLGGEGHADFSFNKRIVLSRDARLLAQRAHCYCDLYWDGGDGGIDLECQSALVHQTGRSFLSDADRTAALKCMGIDVLPVTHDQLADPARFEALARTVAGALGRRRAAKSARQEGLASALHDEVMADWATVHTR